MEERLRVMKKKSPQFIKTNLFAVAEIIFVLAVLLFVMTETKRRCILAGGFVGATACCVAQLFFGKTKVNNKSGADIEYLNETESGNRPSYTLPNGEKQYDIDGIRYDSLVYKIPDGVHVTVKNGRVVPHSIIGKFLYHVEGGVLASPPNDSWNKLFDR